MTARAVALRPKFEPHLRPLYLLIAVSALIGMALMLTMRFVITFSAFSVAFLPAYIVFAGMMARRIDLPRIATGLECGALIYQQGVVTLLILFPVAALSGPYADDLLARWDQALGLDWVAYLQACKPYTRLLVYAYKSFNWQPILLALCLIVSGAEKRLFQLVTAAFVGGVMVILLFPFFPAQGPMTHYGITPADFPELKGNGPWVFLPVLEALKHGQRTISPAEFTGMVAFPSYHSVAALQFTWAGWRLKYLRWFFVLTNVGLLAATPVVGNHYFVDVVAGLVVGAVAIFIASRLVSEECNPPEAQSRTES